MERKNTSDNKQTLIWSIRRLLAEWASAHELVRELMAETEKYDELSRDCYDTLYRSIIDGTPHGTGHSSDLSQALEHAESVRRECAETIRRN
ncbi:hypothetical protein FACS1894184_14440 [Clostridia bacterium]|nr:hypothetical protein FACS1894184_14440 [Clostridia bacterium]